ncbi:hypothetical protein BJ508DRAFT_26909 [Ascobolus immersus RN42]|uniref:Uncharacterized protein n=1 Tax=Ascobolus immersus RN42 TaxID=1160509 RepID=A0A3N4IH83_ASCIM|nr:hypothetical protein BJ508DRAFT_26909 [Ascobolus immersus RN42]
MGTLAFEDGRHTETPPSLSFLNDGNLSIISMSVTLGARASVMKCVEELYEEKSTEISNTTNVQDDIAKTVHEVVEDTMGKLRLSFEDELNRLKELMERECLGAFSGHRLATDHHNLSMIFGNKRKMFGEPDGGSSLGLGVSATDADNNLLRPPPQKRPCGHRRNSSVSSVETMLNLGSGGSSRQIDHSRTVHLTVRSAPEFVCPYSKHNSLTKDHSHRTSCRGTFDGASKLRQHVRIAYRAYFCPVENCFARFPSTDERKGHIEPCKEKGPKASREISVEDREAFKNAKIMMEKNVPLTQIQEIIDQLCKDDNCDCRKPYFMALAFIWQALALY